MNILHIDEQNRFCLQPGPRRLPVDHVPTIIHPLTDACSTFVDGMCIDGAQCCKTENVLAFHKL